MQTELAQVPSLRPRQARAAAEARGDTRWLDHFRRNASRAPGRCDDDVTRLPPALRTVLARSLGRFHLGEAGEGRIVHEVAASFDRAFRPDDAEAVVLYIGEEWRHAAELRGILRTLGAEPPRRSWSELAFRRGRRSMGLRLKLLTMGAAEVAGVVYYAVIAERLGAPSVASIAARIAGEERMHLDFVRELLDRAASEHPLVSAAVDGAFVDVTFAAVALCGGLAVCAEHGELLRLLGTSRTTFLARCRDVLRDASARRARVISLSAGATDTPVRPRHSLAQAFA